MLNPKVLVFDIETAPIKAYVWGLKDQNIGLNQIIQDWSVLAWAAKWLGEDYVWYADVSKQTDLYDDKRILQRLWHLLDEADIVITQYGSGFDSPRLNARFIMHGMKPPSPYKHLDTYRIVKRVAGFTSNKLEYLTDKLCTKYKKLSHKEFTGMSLWVQCLKGNTKAWSVMKKYNIHDVLSTEELYMKLRAWTPAAMPSVYPNMDDRTACPVCGSHHTRKKGLEMTLRGKYQKWNCNDCGKWFQGEKIK
jgi:RNase_H superfamily